MILDKNLTFATPANGRITTSQAICLTQDDLPIPNNGLGPYDGFFLCVIADENVSGLTVTLEDSDVQAGPFATLLTFPAVTVNAGEVIVKAPFPFKSKNWVRIRLSTARRVNAFLTTGVDKGVVIDD